MQVFIHIAVLLLGMSLLSRLISYKSSVYEYAFLAYFFGWVILCLSTMLFFITPFGASLPKVLLTLVPIVIYFCDRERFWYFLRRTRWLLLFFILLAAVVDLYANVILTVDSQQYISAGKYISEGGSIWTAPFNLSQYIYARMFFLPAAVSLGFWCGIDIFYSLCTMMSLWGLLFFSLRLYRAASSRLSTYKSAAVAFLFIGTCVSQIHYHKLTIWFLSNMPAAIYYSIGVILVSDWVSQKKFGSFLIGVFFLSVCTVIRTEFLLYSFLPIYLFGVFCRERLDFKKWLSVAIIYFGVTLPWWLFSVKTTDWNYFHIGGKLVTVLLIAAMLVYLIQLLVISKNSMSAWFVNSYDASWWLIPCIVLLVAGIFYPHGFGSTWFGVVYAFTHGWKLFFLVFFPVFILAVIKFWADAENRYLFAVCLYYLVFMSLGFFYFERNEVELISKTSLRTAIHVFPIIVFLMTANLIRSEKLFKEI